MKPMNEIVENAMIASWVHHFLCNSSQVNQIARGINKKVLRVSGGSRRVLQKSPWLTG